MSHPHHSSASARRQQGSILIPAAAALLVCVILLGAAQLGLYFSVKREAQNAVDLAALNNVVLLDKYREEGASSANCDADMQGFVTAYLQQSSRFDSHLGDGLSVECKQVNHGSGAYEEVSGGTDYNAIDVRLQLHANEYALFSGLGLEHIAASATAYLPAIDDFLAQQRFSVGYVGAHLSNGLLDLVLSTVGLSPQQLQVLSSEGLANVHLTPSGLLQELGLPIDLGADVGTATDLLSLPEVSVANLLNAAVGVLQQQGLAGVDLGLLESAIRLLVELEGFEALVPLFGEGGFIQIAESSSLNAALATQISWAELLNTSIFLANSNNLLDIDLGVPLAPLASVDAKILLVEPQASAPLVVGERANHANARIYLHVKALLGLVDLPLILELGQGSAQVAEVGFNRATATGHVDFKVNGSLLNVCMGRFEDTLFSAGNSCSTSEDFAKVRPHTIVNLLGLLPINAKLTLPILSRDDTATDQVEHMPLVGLGPYKHQVPTASLNLPEIVSALVDGIVFGILADISGGGDPMTADQRRAVAADLIDRDGEGNSVAKVVADVKFSATQFENYRTRISNNPLLGTLGSGLDMVGSILGLVIPDLGCTLAGLGGRDAMYNCREAAVRDLVLGSTTSRIEYVVVTLFESVLTPLITPLNTLLNTTLQAVLNALGLNIGTVEITIDEFSSSDHFEGVLIHSTPASSP